MNNKKQGNKKRRLIFTKCVRNPETDILKFVNNAPSLRTKKPRLGEYE